MIATQNRFTNYRPIMPTQYADNLESAANYYIELFQDVPIYEQQVNDFHSRLTSSFKSNRIKLQKLGISKFERNALTRANQKIRKMIVISDAELKKLRKHRTEKLQSAISEKFQVNLLTLKKIL